MKYFKVDFHVACKEERMLQDACDLLAALAGEAGFETFEETDDGLNGYVQQNCFDRQLLNDTLSEFPMDDVQITYNICEADDEDWNAEWEAEGFDPIVVGNIVVHDGRHLPDTVTKTAIEIDAKMAFGTGNHETTRMMLAALSENCKEKSVLDCGTGTGILAIAALKQGATKAMGYDIDEWSVDNARHNAVINRVDDRFTSLLGDASMLDKTDETFDLVMANINRNILLNDLPRFVKKMHQGSILLLSGFYQADIPLLTEKAEELQLRQTGKQTDGEWACLQFTLPC